MSRDVGRRDNTRERKRDLSASTLTLSNELRADCISAVRSTARFVALGSVTVLLVGFFLSRPDDSLKSGARCPNTSTTQTVKPFKVVKSI